MIKMTPVELKLLCEKFTTDIYGQENPQGYCFSVCYSLSVLFKLLNFEHNLVAGNYKNKIHYWLELSSINMVLDPTIRQFENYNENVLLSNNDSAIYKQNYSKIHMVEDERFTNAFERWANPLLNNTSSCQRFNLMNVKCALAFLSFVENLNLLDALKELDYVKIYLEPIVSYIEYDIQCENSVIISNNINYSKIIDVYVKFQFKSPYFPQH